MTGKLKVLGFMLFAAMAIGAFGAQGATATVSHSFEFEKEKTVITGSGTTNQLFGGTGLKVECQVSHFDGTVNEKVVDQIEVFPKFAVCEEVNNRIPMHVVNSGCTLRFESDTEETVSELHAPLALTCEHATRSITITDEQSLCVIHLSDTHTTGVTTVNQVLHGVTYTNGGSGTTSNLAFDATITGITYELTGELCELLDAKPGTYHNATYDGKVTLKGYEDVDDAETTHVYEHNNLHVGININLAHEESEEVGFSVDPNTSVQDHEFTATQAPAVLTGSSIGAQVFKGTGLVTECKALTLDGTVGEKVQDTIKLYPRYRECEEANSSLELHVANNGCAFEFESDTVEHSTENHAPVKLTCDHEGSITFTDEFNLCVEHISDTHTGGESTVNQELLGFTYENESSGGTEDVIVDATVTGIAYELTGAFCELLGANPGTHDDKIHIGSITISAYED